MDPMYEPSAIEARYRETMSEGQKKKVRNAAWGITKGLFFTMGFGGTGMVAAPSNEAAWVMAGVGAAIDTYRFIRRVVKDRGEQLAANAGVETAAQTEATKGFEKLLREQERRHSGQS